MSGDAFTIRDVTLASGRVGSRRDMAALRKIEWMQLTVRGSGVKALCVLLILAFNK